MITSFLGKYFFLSNFYTGEKFFHQIGDLNLLWDSSEHAFMAGKNLDPNYVLKVHAAPNPGTAKMLGRQVKLRDDWEDIKFQWMLEVLMSKFNPGSSCLKRLLETEKETLHEFNSHGDRIWGQTYDIASKKWIGENYLGKALMAVRDARNPKKPPTLLT